MLTIKLITLLAGSVVIVWFSRNALKVPGSHGFYRFFAWEFILLLFIRNMGFWFVNPFSWHQWLAWLFLLTSIILLIWGTILLKSQGTAGARRDKRDPSLHSFERTSHLVTSGIFRYIRHPMYSSLLFLAWGIFFKNISWASSTLVLVAMGFLFITAIADEAECIQYFGKSYLDYMKRTRRFIPFLL